jgi:hypothetical protein
LPIKQVIALKGESPIFNASHWEDWYAQKEGVICFNSDKYDGLSHKEAVSAVAADLEKLAKSRLLIVCAIGEFLVSAIGVLQFRLFIVVMM